MNEVHAAPEIEGVGAPVEPSSLALKAALQIEANHAETAAVDTGDPDECAFIFAAAALVKADAGVAAQIGQLMMQPGIKDAIWRKEDRQEANEG